MVARAPQSSPLDRLFLEALLAGDRAEATRVLGAAADVGMAYALAEVLQPAMHRIGELWFEGHISIGAEHLATALAETAVSSLYVRFPWPVGGPKALIMCAPGETHMFAARVVADLLALDGWDTIVLAGDLSLDEMTALARRTAPVFIGLSITLPHHLRHVEPVIQSFREIAVPPKILLGGQAAQRLSEQTKLEADAVAGSGSEGVQAARAWKP